MTKLSIPWSYVNEVDSRKKKRPTPGNFTREMSIRDRVIAGAFGRKLRTLRTSKNLSQRMLAEIVGVSQPFVAQLEATRIKNIMLNQVFDFAEALDVDPRVFVDACSEACQRFERGLIRKNVDEALSP